MRETLDLDAATIVEIDDVRERLLAAVVHIGPAPRHVAERRRLEGALVSLVLRHRVSPEVRVGLVHPDADVAVAFVGEVEAGVAGHAARPAREERLPPLGRRRERALLAGAEPVVGEFPETIVRT